MREGVQRTDVGVIGGGIIGVRTALWMADRVLAATLWAKGKSGVSNPAGTGAGAALSAASSANANLNSVCGYGVA